MKISNNLKKRFCKDTGIPINVFDDDIFNSRIKLYNSIYNSLFKYNNFKKMLDEFNDEQEYFEYYNKINNNAIEYIKNKKSYIEFNNEDFNKYKIENYGIRSKTIYKQENIGKEMISIDIKKANYSCMMYYNPEIVGYATTYEEFLRKFTNNEHIVNSKYIRQVIFGNLNPKRQVSLQKYMTFLILKELLNIVSLEDIEFFSNDEIVVVNKDKELIKKIKDICSIFSFETRIENFKLIYLENFDCYIKKFKNLNYDIKCINSLLLPILVKLLKKESILDEDLIFYYEGRLAKLVDYPSKIIEVGGKINEK